MKSCVVYESMYGNTHEVADAIAKGLARVGETRVGSVADIAADELGDVDLVVVGGPTHVHGLSRASSRKAAVESAAKDASVELDPDAPGPGLRDWLRQLDQVDQVDQIHFAAFDTRIDKPVILVGSAAKGIAKQLRRLRFAPLVKPESFFVDDSAGPLHDGELERAHEWGIELGHEFARLQE